MAYERYPGSNDPQGDRYGRQDPRDYGRDDGSGRTGDYPGARDYGASGRDDRQGQRGDRQGQRGDRYGAAYSGRDERGGYRGRDEARPGYGARDDRGGGGGQAPYHGSYASDGHRFEDVGRYAHADDDNYRQGQDDRYAARPQGGAPDDRGFFQRAGDEVRSWFGDEEAERRRDQDHRYEQQGYGAGDRHQHHRDSDYHNWRSGQIAALDRDYDEYRQEHRSRFENEFATWRTSRQGQRDALNRVAEHMDVVGSDGEHVGTVDKVQGDRILLTKNDADAGGRHHSIPSRWVEAVEGSVTLNKTAAEAKKQWQDEERSQAMFRYGDGADDANRSGQSGSAQASSSSTSRARTY